MHNGRHDAIAAADYYLATDGRTEQAFPFTAEGLRAAWAFALTLRFGTVQNPNRCDLDFDGMSDDERDVREEL